MKDSGLVLIVFTQGCESVNWNVNDRKDSLKRYESSHKIQKNSKSFADFVCLVDDSKRQQPHVFKCKTKPTFYAMLLLYIVIVTSTPLRPVGSVVCNVSQSDSNEMIKATGSFFLVLFSQGRSAEWL